MATQRRKSVPPPSKQPISSGSTLSELSSLNTSPSFYSTSSTAVQPPQGGGAAAATTTSLNKLSSRADALAKLTFELNIRTVENNVQGLQKTIKDLVQATADNKEFRSDNEERLSKLWQEMLVVRQQAERCENQQVVTQKDMADMQKETGSLLAAFGEEVQELKESIQDITGMMAELSKSGDNGSKESGYGSLDFKVDLGADLAPTQRIDYTTYAQQPPQNQQALHQDGTRDAVPPSAQSTRSPAQRIESRINEALGSTRRWNRDHKTTQFKDSVFCANYLKQQSKRDVKLAVYIQKSLGKRIRKRVGRSRSKPNSIEEFCRDVTWHDVLQTVQESLVDQKHIMIRELGG